MVFGMEDPDHVDLNLSLGISITSPADPRSALISLPALRPPPPPPQPPCWNDVFFGCGRKVCHEMPFLRGIDVNRAPVAKAGRENYSEDYEEAGLSSPNSTLSSLSGKRGLPAASGGGVEQETERSGSRGPAGSDDEDGADTGAGGSRKKLRLSKDQSAVLEESFREHNTLNPRQKLALANQLNLKPRQVEVWFQNRRARTKLKQTEMDCEFLKRCCESLTEENRRLQKEVQELRALEVVSPPLYMQMAPPTTLTMCPSCERVSGAASSGLPPKPSHSAAAVGPSRPSGPVPLFLDGPAHRP